MVHERPVDGMKDTAEYRRQHTPAFPASDVFAEQSQPLPIVLAE